MLGPSAVSPRLGAGSFGTTVVGIPAVNVATLNFVDASTGMADFAAAFWWHWCWGARRRC